MDEETEPVIVEMIATCQTEGCPMYHIGELCPFVQQYLPGSTTPFYQGGCGQCGQPTVVTEPA